MGPFELASTLRDLAARNPGRTEADIQAMIRDVLVFGGFDLEAEAVHLESPAEDRRRLDVQVGAVIVECKRDVRPAGALAKAEIQLGEYLAAKAEQGSRYVGILTDGVEWRLYRHSGSGPVAVDQITLTPQRIDDRAFRWWLGAVLATEEQVTPTANSIEERLGARSPSFLLARDTLLDCWRAASSRPAVALKRELWAKLLRSALGSQFENTDELFVEHTYLVLLANLFSHAVVGFDLRAARHDPGVLLSGQLFERAGLLGVGQAGFFDWVLDSPTGSDVVSDLARRIASFSLDHVEHDVLKVLYQSVIAPDIRHRLGEYYTPDWLAYRIVRDTVDEPLNRRVLDPACGSGTFVFHAVRRYLDASTAAEVPVPDAISGVTSSVFGVDLHPVAVALAQATYLLAIGRDRLAQRTGTLSVPVYLGDSMRWEAPDEDVFSSGGDVVLHTTDSTQLFATELRFPAAVVADVARFDDLVSELAARASDRPLGTAPLPLGGMLTRFGVAESDQSVVAATYRVLCDLYDQGRNHIWGFYIRNQSRPTWLARPENRVDVVVGNPPWLAYRFMSEALQKVFQRRARERNLWLGGGQGRTTQQDLSAFFVARSIELYLKVGGRFGFVMPRAVLSRQTYAGFRAGDYSSGNETCFASFRTPWDLNEVEPEPFPVPSCVVFGVRTTEPKPVPGKVLAWSGKSPQHGVGEGSLVAADGAIAVAEGGKSASPYKSQFRNGAILAPRMLVMVTNAEASPVGVAIGRRAVRSRKTTLDKRPWLDLPPHEGVVESIFVRPVYLGESVAPFRVLRPFEAVLPFDGTRLMASNNERIDRYPGLARWWRGAEEIWIANRSSEKRTLLEQLDYMHQLSAQFPIRPIRVVYSKAGNTLAAAWIQDATAIIDCRLYWAPTETLAEAQYLAAILNSTVLTTLVRPYQSVGAFGPRDFDKYVWQMPIPLFDPAKALHQHLVTLAGQAEAAARSVSLPTSGRFQAARRAIRQTLSVSGLATELDLAVKALLGPSA
ncbi:MAG: class I SAM-dependent methyltransferase [Candidatus Dormiibacterota bacterium]